MRITENRFTSVEMAKDEEYMGCIFSDVQVAHIRNNLSLVAAQILDLISNHPGDDVTYFRMLQYLRGKLDAFEGLLQYSDAMKENMNSEIQQVVNDQPAFMRRNGS